VSFMSYAHYPIMIKMIGNYIDLNNNEEVIRDFVIYHFGGYIYIFRNVVDIKPR
jgi:hypothetical protein